MNSKIISKPRTDFDIENVEDATEDILDDILLRNATRSFIKLWQNVFSARLPQKDDPKSLTERLDHPKLVSFILSNGPVLEVFLESILLLIAVPDTVSCRLCLILATELLELFLPLSDSYGFLGSRLLLSCFNVLQDGYQATNHTQVINLIISIYKHIGSKSPIPNQTFQSLGMNTQTIAQFETKLHSENQKSMYQHAQQLFSSITGIEVSQWGTLRQDVRSDKRLEFLKKKGGKSGGILHELNDGNVLGNLFE